MSAEDDLFKSLFDYTGFSVAERRRKTGKVGFQHRLKKEDAMKWFQQKVYTCVTHIFSHVQHQLLGLSNLCEGCAAVFVAKL